MTDTLSQKQHKAIAALLIAPSIKAAAEQAGCGERTLRGWLDDPAFQATYRAAQRAMVDQATAQLQQHSSAAVQVLVDVMNDTTKSPVARISAASKVLEFAIKAVELNEFAQRLAALEAVYGTKS